MVTFDEFLRFWEKYGKQEWIIVGRVGREILFRHGGYAGQRPTEYSDLDILTFGNERNPYDKVQKIGGVPVDFVSPEHLSTFSVTRQDILDKYLATTRIQELEIKTLIPEFHAVSLLCQVGSDNIEKYLLGLLDLLPLGLDEEKMAELFGKVRTIAPQNYSAELLAGTYHEIMGLYKESGELGVLAAFKEGHVFNLYAHLEVQQKRAFSEFLVEHSSFSSLEDISQYVGSMQYAVSHAQEPGTIKNILGFLIPYAEEHGGESTYAVGVGIDWILQYAPDQTRALGDMITYTLKHTDESDAIAVRNFGSGIGHALEYADPELRVELYAKMVALQDSMDSYNIFRKGARIGGAIKGKPLAEQRELSSMILDDPARELEDTREMDPHFTAVYH